MLAVFGQSAIDVRICAIVQLVLCICLYHCPLNKYNIDRGGGEAKKEAACRNEDS
jgi:hypothetical protein